jgi:hypothetical protein
MVDFSMAMTRICIVVMPRIMVVASIGLIVVRSVAAIMQEGPWQCQEAHRNDEQTCEI